MPRFGRSSRGGRSGKGSITVTATMDPPLRQIAQKLDKMAQKDLKDFRPIWDKLIPVVKSETHRLIASKGALIGSPWAKHSKAYAKRKHKRGTLAGAGLLNLTGALRRSIGVLSRARGSLRFGVKGLPYARSIQFGLKPRKFVAATPTIETKFHEFSDQFVQDMLRKYGFK